MDWTEEDQLQGEVISVPPEIYARGCVRDVDDGLEVRPEGTRFLQLLWDTGRDEIPVGQT